MRRTNNDPSDVSLPAGYNPPVAPARGRIVIVARHPGLVAWLSAVGVAGDVIPHATEADVRDAYVFGVVPLHLAALAEAVAVVDMPGLTLEQRGRDMTPAEMDAAGARVSWYRVSACPCPMKFNGNSVLAGGGAE